MMKRVSRAIFTVAVLLTAAPARSAGTLTIATVLGQPYPLQAIGYPPYAFHPAQFDGLTEMGANGALAPALALSWRAEGDTTWVFELRPHIQFANGEPFDADAVVAMIAHVRSDEGRRMTVTREAATILRAEARGLLTVAFVTSVPDLMLPQKLISVKMLPPRYLREVGVEGFNKRPYGTGPFMEVSRTPAKVVLRPNPHAWRPPKLDRLTVVSLPDNTTRVQALAAKQVDVALDINIEDIPVVEGGGGRVLSIPSGSVDVIQFNTSKPSPLRDARVRRALNYAVDKDRIVRALLYGLTRVASQFASKGTFGFDDALSQPFPYDPAKAKALLAEAGYPDGFDLPIELMVSVMTAPFEQAAADLRALGVRAGLTTITVPSYSAHYTQNTWTGLAFYGGYNAVPSMDALAPLRLHSCLWPNPWYCDKEITALISAADATFERTARLSQTRALMARLNADPPAILLYDGFKMTALGPRVKTYESPHGFVRYDILEASD